MTVPTSTAKSGPYAGAGTTGPFTVGFRFLENSHLQIIRTSTLGVDSTLTLTTDYTVTGAGGSSGTVTLITALATGEKLTIIRNVPFTQDADYVQNDAFPAESHERALDKLTMQTQQLAEEIGRALTLPATAASVSTTLPLPQANNVIGWNESGSGLANVDPGTLATIVAYGTAKSDIFTGDGVTTAFSLTVEPGSLNNLDVAIGGVTQLPGVDYTWASGTVVTFTTAPVLGDKVLIRYMQGLPFGTADASDVIFAGGNTVEDLRGAAGSSLVGFQQSGTGAVARTAQDKIRETYSVFDAEAKGDSTTDDTAAQNVAVNYIQSTYDPAIHASNSPANGPCSLFYPAGFYRTSGTVNISKKVAFKGDGPAEFSSGSRVVQFAPGSDLFRITPIAQGMSVSFEDMTLRAVGTGTGHLINIQKSTADCNSQRYYNMVFGTPAALALNIQAGDDVIIDNCLFDAAALSTIALGTSAATHAVSNVRLKTPAFFAVNQRCILAYNIDGLQIIGAQVYPSGSGRTGWFIDGYNTLPHKINNVSILGGNFKSVDCLVNATAVNNLKIENTSCSNFGAGSGATLGGIELTGTCVGVSITGNTFSGSFGSKNFYNDSSATVTQANITGNTFVNTGGGAGQALVCGNTLGVIANNTFIGFSTPSVSELVTTTGNAVSPGVIGALAKWDYSVTVTGARQGDRVEFGTVALAWPVPVGIEVQAFVSGSNTVTISYRNVTGSPIGVPAHDVRYCVIRGV